MRQTGLVEIKQAISYTHRDPLYHIPGSSVVYCTATLYVSPTKLCLFPYLPASLCHYVRMSIQIILHHSLPLSPWSRQAAKLIKTRARSFIVFLASWLSMTHSMHTPRIINQINTHRDMDTHIGWLPVICVDWMLHQILIGPYAKDKHNSAGC